MTDASKVKIYQRIGPGEWKFRAELDQSGKGLKAWADENGDEQLQPNEWRSKKWITNRSVIRTRCLVFRLGT
jgi:hypothetical protein